MEKKNDIFKSGEPPTGAALKKFRKRIEEEKKRLEQLEKNLEKMREKGTGIPLRMPRQRPQPKPRSRPQPRPQPRPKPKPMPRSKPLPKPKRRQRQRPTTPPWLLPIPTQMAYGGGKVKYRSIGGTVVSGNDITRMIYD
jgi:hypothetical protein